MQRQRREAVHRERPIHNPEISLKIPAKRITNLPRHALAGQQSAHRPTRPIRQTAIEGALEDAVRTSAIYRMLEEEMKAMKARHEAEQGRLRELKVAREQQLARAKQEEFATKLQIWELKNQVMELKESIREQREEEARLEQQLGEPNDELPHEESQQPPTH